MEAFVSASVCQHQLHMHILYYIFIAVVFYVEVFFEDSMQSGLLLLLELEAAIIQSHSSII